MTPRTLFIIILKVLGILSLKELLISIPQLISIVLSFFKGYPISESLYITVISLLAIAFNLAVSYVLLFKADYLVNKLGLAEGISEPLLQLNISLPSIFRIAIIITGFLLLVLEIPEFVRIIYILLQKRELYMQDDYRDWSPAVFSGIKIILGLLIIGERKRILAFLEKTPDSEQTKEV